MKNNQERWKLAQNYERTWWQNQVEEIDLEFYSRFAREVTEDLKPFFSIKNNSYVLEIGSGAAGIITYIKSEHKFAIDPLERFYSSVPKYVSVRDKKVIYSTAMAESLPFKGVSFDLIIIDNVLDHCDVPDKVLSEMNRTLKPGGIVFFRQNTYHFWGKVIRDIMEKMKIDKGHPHTFLKSKLKNMIRDQKFRILYIKKGGYSKTWLKEITSKRAYDKIKGILFVNRDKTTYVLKKM